MLWAISRVWRPDATAAELEKVHAAHHAYLISQRHLIVLSGARLSDDGFERTGSLLIINVDSRAAAQAFINADPFTKADLFTDLSIRRMRKEVWNPDAAEGA